MLLASRVLTCWSFQLQMVSWFEAAGSNGHQTTGQVSEEQLCISDEPSLLCLWIQGPRTRRDDQPMGCESWILHVGIRWHRHFEDPWFATLWNPPQHWTRAFPVSLCNTGRIASRRFQILCEYFSACFTRGKSIQNIEIQDWSLSHQWLPYAMFFFLLLWLIMLHWDQIHPAKSNQEAVVAIDVSPCLYQCMTAPWRGEGQEIVWTAGECIEN